MVDRVTKELVKRLKRDSIAVIRQTDLDEVAAETLLRRQPQAIINFGTTITGNYPARGAEILLKKNIPLYDVLEDYALFEQLRDGAVVTISTAEKKLMIPDLKQSICLLPITRAIIDQRIGTAIFAYNRTFSHFAENSLRYAQLEREEFSKTLPGIKLQTSLRKRPVVIVARGSNVYQDFETIKPYIQAIKPVLIGVDGGADIIYEYGFLPDIIVGDMDSVSTQVLKKGRDRIVHSYPDGYAPGLKRIIEHKLEHQILPFTGTSEDVTLLLAYEHGASRIILVGSHTNMVDFLEKGRQGMGSTLLTRMKMGHLLIDAKGMHTLITPQQSTKISYLLFASSIPVFSLILVSPELRFFAYTIWIQIRMLFY